MHRYHDATFAPLTLMPIETAIAVLVAAGNREHPHPRHVAVPVSDTPAIAIVRNVPAEHGGNTELPFDLAQDQHATIRRQLSTIKRCCDCFRRPVTGRVETA
jgi:hypothetical protein